MSSKTNSGISRRRLLGSGAAAGAGALLAGASSAEVAAAKSAGTSTKRLKADVCVVGGGFAGLSAAKALVEGGKSVVVLEARDRVGGRSWSFPIKGATDVANMGATFVGPTQHEMIALCKEMGISLFPTYSTGKLLWYENGKGTPYTGTIPPASDPLAVVELGEVVLPAFEKMAATVPIDAPWDAPNAEAWDAETVASWAKENTIRPGTAQLLDLAVNAVLSVQSRDVSLLYMLWYSNSAGGLQALIGNAGTGAGQDFRVSGGTQSVAIALAKRLGVGKRVLLEHAVRKIVQTDSGITVEADQATVEAKHVIVAIAPHLAGRIVYDPPLPGQRDQLTQRLPIGSLIKTIAVYDTPFWREDGLNGQVTSVEGAVDACFDASPESGTPGVMLGFIDGDQARLLSDQSEAVRQAAALESYVNYFGPKAAYPREYFDMPWERQIYTRGCPVGISAPGVLTRYGKALRDPIGRIHWAGTETATVWAGYMDGAIQSGKRAAAEILTHA
jgi:monoamine oxidase